MWESFENEISSQSLDFIKWVRPRTFPHFLFLYLKNEQIFFFNPIILNIIWNTRRSAVFSHLISSFFFSYHISRLFSQFYFPPFSFFISYFPLVLSRFNFHLLSYRLNSGIIIRWFWGFFGDFFFGLLLSLLLFTSYSQLCSSFYFPLFFASYFPLYFPNFFLVVFPAYFFTSYFPLFFFSHTYFPLFFFSSYFRLLIFLILISRTLFSSYFLFLKRLILFSLFPFSFSVSVTRMTIYCRFM